MGRVYLVCAVVMAVGFVVALVIPERPLRTRAGLSDAMEQQTVADGPGSEGVQPGLRQT